MSTLPPSPVDDRLLKVPEMATEMCADEKTVYRRIRSGKLKAFREGGRWLIWRSTLRAYLGKPETDGGSSHA